MLIHKGTIEIETNRLILRRFKEDDARDMYNNWTNDSDVTRYLSWQAHANVQETKDILLPRIEQYEKEDFYYWAITLKNKNIVIGGIGAFNIFDTHLRCDVGFALGKEYWNMGIMTEALQALIKYLFNDIGFNRIQSSHHKDNHASGKVLTKSGMVQEGIFRQHQIDKEGKFADFNVYSIIKEDFSKQITSD